MTSETGCAEVLGSGPGSLICWRRLFFHHKVTKGTKEHVEEKKRNLTAEAQRHGAEKTREESWLRRGARCARGQEGKRGRGISIGCVEVLGNAPGLFVAGGNGDWAINDLSRCVSALSLLNAPYELVVRSWPALRRRGDRRLDHGTRLVCAGPRDERNFMRPTRSNPVGFCRQVRNVCGPCLTGSRTTRRWCGRS
jgi:hypothetical protein